MTGLVDPPRRLAEPLIPGGRVEALMGRLIKVLAHSPLARPWPAVALSALGLSGVAFVGLCATAPQPSRATLPVLLPLTAAAQRYAGMPRLGNAAEGVLMYASIALCALGLAMMLWANSRGWSPRPHAAFCAAAGAVALLVNVTPVGSADIASYAAYGRIAALGRDPYAVTPIQLPGGSGNPYTALVSPQWRDTPSVYGPVATWTHLLAAEVGGTRPWLSIWVLMIMTAAAFVATGYLLLRTAANPVRAVLLWVANPLLIAEFVMGGHLDNELALAAIASVVLSRRCTRRWHDLVVGLLVGVSGGIQINAGLVALGIAIPLIHDRAWARLARTAVTALLTTAALYYFSWGFSALRPLWGASKMVGSPIWRLIQVTAQAVAPGSLPAVTTVIGYAWAPLTLLLAWYLYNRLSPDVPTVVAATCALTFAWVIAAPWSLPWYTSIAWVTLALLPRNSLTRWLTLVTAVLAILHFNGGWHAAPGGRLRSGDVSTEPGLGRGTPPGAGVPRAAGYRGQERRDDITTAQLPSLEALRRFVVVAEELSFTRAARRLHVVQSGVSSVIAALERELGATLFDRDRHAVALTEAGRALLPEARAALAAAQAAADAVAETTAGLRGTLSVGTMLSTGPVDVPGLIGRFHQAHPGVLVRLRQAPGGSADLARAVADGTLDLALLSLPGEPPAGIETWPLAQERMVLTCAPWHRLAGSPGVCVDALGGETFIDHPPGWGTRTIVDRAFAAAGIDRQVAFEVANYATAAGLVSQGLGVAFVPESAVAEMPGVVQIPLNQPSLSWRIQVATAARRRPSAAARAFLDELRYLLPR